MVLKKRIPKDFYKLFRTRNRDAYMQFLAAIYEANSAASAALGLTLEECCALIEDTIAKARIIWEEEEEPEVVDFGASPSAMLHRLIHWGWLKSDFDERLNAYVISFPEYSRLFTELFQKLEQEEENLERESILSIYSALFTYHAGKEKNNEILKNTVQISQKLGQLLSNMQDGMRAYFEELSGQKNFLDVQKVLVEEIHNSDSKKYAILTTSDSFYRYKEEVKELMSEILNANEQEKERLLREGNEKRIQYCEEANLLVYRIEYEFDRIERKYNKLIEQKTMFAKRALARIHYILQEGAAKEDAVLNFIQLLNRSDNQEEILQELQTKIRFSAQFKNLTDGSFANRRERVETEFTPLAVRSVKEHVPLAMSDFVPEPIYTKKQLRAFCEKNTVDGRFVVTEETVQSVEDLEKLLFLWQEETQERYGEDYISVDGEISGKDGFTYSKLTIESKESMHQRTNMDKMDR